MSVEKPVPRFAAEVEVVEAYRQPVAGEELRTLVPRHPQHSVARVEPVVERFAARGIAVVDLVPPPVVEEAQGARRAVVAVGQGGGGPSARDARVVVDERRRHLARIRCVEVRQVHVARQRPCSRKLVSQLGVAAVLFEAHVGAVAVGAVVGAGDDAREASLADTVRQLGLQRVVGAVGGLQVGADALLALLARDDVDDAAHGVGTVEYRGGAAYDFDALGQHRLVGVGDRMSHEPHILRMAVDEYQQARGRQPRLRCAADAAQRHAARRSGRDSVAHDPARGGEEPRHLFGEYGQQRLPAAAFDRGAVDHRDGHRKEADVGFVARARDDDLLDRVDGALPHAVGQLVGDGGRNCEQQRGCQYRVEKGFHFCPSIKLRISGSASAAVAQSRQSVSTGHCPVRVRLTI